jgi:hypothetical protein
MPSRASALALVLAGAAAAGAPGSVGAAQVASLSVNPTRAQAGARVAVVGRRFPIRARVRLYFGSRPHP